ncbi:MAG: hypothetical protein Q9207_005077 [Kuettlingeria erythrocarpa]
MAEVAAAASAAGLASLGLQCCKGLTTYYSSYQAYDERIGAAFEQIQGLTAIFEQLERLLSQQTRPPAQGSSLQQVDTCLNRCRGSLNKLESMLQICQSVALPNTTMASWRKIKSQALFPFREQTLRTLRENVQSLRDDLQVSLSILQTDMEIAQNLSIASLAASSRNTELVTQNTQSDIQAIASPVQRILQQGEDTKIGLSEILTQTHQNHENVLNYCRNIPEQYRLLLQQEQTSSRSLEQTLVTVLGQLGTEREFLRSVIKSLDQKQKPQGETEELAKMMGVLVRTLQWRSPRLTAK